MGSISSKILPADLKQVGAVNKLPETLEARARELAATGGFPFAHNRCESNAWFAGKAAHEARRHDVQLIAGFRDQRRSDLRWHDDYHVWISIDGQHYETSPDNEPHGVTYLMVPPSFAIDDPLLKRTIFDSDETLVTKLMHWAASPERFGGKGIFGDS